MADQKEYAIGRSVAYSVPYAATIELNPSRSREIVTVALTGNATISIGDDAKPVVGDELIIKASSDGTARNITFGTGITAPALSGTINKTKVQRLVYDGLGFIAASAFVQID